MIFSLFSPLTLSKPLASSLQPPTQRQLLDNTEKPSENDVHSVNGSIYDGSTLRGDRRSSAFSFAPSIRSSVTAYSSFRTSINSKGSPKDVPALSSPVVRMGFACVKEETFASLFWTRKWLVLREDTLAFHKHEGSLQTNVLNLREVTNVERTDHRAFCLLLDMKDKRTLISFESDEELYEWQDDIYSRSSVGTSWPTNFVHKYHAFVNPFSNAVTGLPEGWTRLVTQSVDHTRNPSEVYLEDFFYENPTSQIVRTGFASVKKETFASFFWNMQWLVLSEDSLTFCKTENSPGTVVYLRDIMNVERTDRKEYCLLLETKDKCIFLSLQDDEELYGWQDDIYSRLSLVGNPAQFVHHIHVGFDPNSGAFTGLPDGWSRLLNQSATAIPACNLFTQSEELKGGLSTIMERIMLSDAEAVNSFQQAIVADAPITAST